MHFYNKTKICFKKVIIEIFFSIIGNKLQIKKTMGGYLRSGLKQTSDSGQLWKIIWKIGGVCLTYEELVGVTHRR